MIKEAKSFHIQNCTFLMNIIQNIMIHIVNVEKMVIINVVCFQLNIDKNESELGVFLRTENIFSRIFKNLIIKLSISNKGTVGVACKDDEIYMKIKFENNQLNKSQIVLDNCLFENNSVSFYGISPISVAFFLESFIECHIKNSTFKVMKGEIMILNYYFLE